MSARIVVPDDYPPVFSGSAAESRLRGLGEVTVHTERGADQEPELIRRVADAEVVLNIRAHARYFARVLDACPKLRLISIWGTGTDHVDLAACQARGVTVVTTTGVNANAVAEHALALLLSLMRRIPALDHDLRAGGWAREPVVQLEGKTVGIIGLGAIGSRVATLLAPFGVLLLATSSRPDDGRAAAVGARYVPIEVMLRESDVVSLHLRVTPETQGYVSRERLALMKPTAFLVNTARGALIDADALVDALRHGRLAGAALDVFQQEPISAADPLLTLPNVVLTPHIAGMTPEVIEDGLDLAVRNIEQFLLTTPAIHAHS
ncbi:MAG: NAD(P)-dependent oxidoreductase [Gemmatimonadota bacterium]